MNSALEVINAIQATEVLKSLKRQNPLAFALLWDRAHHSVGRFRTLVIWSQLFAVATGPARQRAALSLFVRTYWGVSMRLRRHGAGTIKSTR